MNNKFKILVFALLLGSPFFDVKAATLYLNPDKGDYGLNDVIPVEVRLDLDSADECINTIQAVVGFDKNFLEAVDFSAGESILSLWIDQPKTGDMADINHEQRIKFTGGTPGGYCGKVPGDPGDSNIVAKLYFKVVNFDQGAIPLPKAKVYFLDDTKALLNDGLGTEAKLSFKPAEFTITGNLAKDTKVWDNAKQGDFTPPEAFKIELLKNAGMFEGKYYIAFSTVDKQTGIDHYEIQEVREPQRLKDKSFRDLFYDIFVITPDLKWKTATVPYVLEDQTLRSVIKVRAIDKAGNQFVATLPAQAQINGNGSAVTILSIVLLLIIMSSAWYLSKKIHLKLK
ncbi:hypothetical protein HGA64_01375 [Candidatus Falkowbacteria bacterium]|nr:hypothetical protein [Candidatus Falkowbacteria bacterium]